MFLVGIDVGTTHCKAAAYTVDGQEVALSSISTPTRTKGLPRGWAEYDPHTLWQGVAACLRDLAQQLGEEAWRHVAAVAVTSMGEAGVLVDATGEPLVPFIAWYDERTRPQMHALGERMAYKQLYRTTGTIAHPKFGVYKLMWWRENEPAIYERAVCWLAVADFISFRLSGEMASEYSLACRSGAFDIHRLCWASSILEAAHLDSELLPPVYPAGTRLGKVTSQAAQETGLRAGIPVVTGGHDHVCGALSAGVLEPGALLNSKGTAEAILAPLAEPQTTDAAFAAGIACGCHVVPRRYTFLTGNPTGGGALEWFMQQFGLASYAQLLRELAVVGSEPSGLVFLPLLRGGREGNPLDKGAFIGLEAEQRRGDMAKAVVEGLALELKVLVETVAALAGTGVHTIRAIGGGTRNPAWLRLTADCLGAVVEVPAREEAATHGAALLAGIGIGVYRDAKEAVAMTWRVQERRQPVLDRQRVFQDVYEHVFLPLRKALRPYHRALSAAISQPK